jgi:malonyl-CoA O-methyltransferase
MHIIDRLMLRRRRQRAALKPNDAACFFHREILHRLLERLDYMKLVPRRVLYLGLLGDEAAALLIKRYPGVELVYADSVESSLRAYRRHWWQKPIPRLVLDAEALGLAGQSFDLIIANLHFVETNEPDRVFQEAFRILRPEGLLLFSTLGPDSFKELSQVAYPRQLVHGFIDMHHLGDMLIKRGFLDPVVDMEYIQLRYQRLKDLGDDLKALGLTNARLDRHRGLLGRGFWRAREEAYRAQWQLLDGALPVTVEMIYGQSWRPLHDRETQINQGGEVLVPVEQLLNRPARR